MATRDQAQAILEQLAGPQAALRDRLGEQVTTR